MSKLGDVASHVRSKVAGPFWVTIDIFFEDHETYARWYDNPSLRPGSIAKVYEVAPESVSIYPVEKLNMVKISYPRAHSQGGVLERDLHSGQQFAYLLDVEMA
jgi:hypothetical protein